MAKMKKINLKSKLTWKNILIIGLSVLLLIGAIFGISALFNENEKTTKTIKPSFAIGGLTENGTYLDTTESIYTKDSFECYGLKCTLDFDNNISYRIFFYDYNNNFVSATEKLTTNYSEDVDLFVKSARIVITPNEDSKISWYEKNGYAKQLTISVNKEQPKDAFSSLKFHKVATKVLGTGEYNNKQFQSKSTPFYFLDKIDVSNCNTLIMKLKSSTLINKVTYSSSSFSMPIIYDADSTGSFLSITYDILAVDGDFSFISYDVSSYNTVILAVDVDSIDFVECYLV